MTRDEKGIEDVCEYYVFFFVYGLWLARRY